MTKEEFNKFLRFVKVVRIDANLDDQERLKHIQRGLAQEVGNYLLDYGLISYTTEHIVHLDDPPGCSSQITAECIVIGREQLFRLYEILRCINDTQTELGDKTQTIQVHDEEDFDSTKLVNFNKNE